MPKKACNCSIQELGAICMLIDFMCVGTITSYIRIDSVDTDAWVLNVVVLK